MPNAVTEQQARQVGEWRGIWYRSWPGGKDYSFTYTLTAGSWRVYINTAPNYGRRSSSSIDTHRLDISNHPYICWDQPINTLSQAQGVSALWADCTERYIATGRFEPPPGRPTVQDRSVLNGFGRPALAAVSTASPWHEDPELRVWGAGLAAMTFFGFLWVLCLSGGFGGWAVFLMLMAAIGTGITIHSTRHRPGGRGWAIAYAVCGTILGFTTLAGSSAGLLWILTLVGFVATVVQYATAANRLPAR